MFAANTTKVFLRKMLGTWYGSLGTRFLWFLGPDDNFLILGTRFSILGTQIGSLKHLNTLRAGVRYIRTLKLV